MGVQVGSDSLDRIKANKKAKGHKDCRGSQGVFTVIKGLILLLKSTEKYLGKEQIHKALGLKHGSFLL